MALAVVFACDVGVRPVSWGKVHLGESYVDLKKEFPGLRDQSHASKGVDRLIEPRLTGQWITYYMYEGDRICMRSLVYRIGTQEFYKEILVTYERTADFH